jgi:hypothetical protein
VWYFCTLLCKHPKTLELEKELALRFSNNQHSQFRIKKMDCITYIVQTIFLALYNIEKKYTISSSFLYIYSDRSPLDVLIIQKNLKSAGNKLKKLQKKMTCQIQSSENIY